MYVITAHQRHRQTDRQTDVKRSHDRYIAKACSGKNPTYGPYFWPYFREKKTNLILGIIHILQSKRLHLVL